MKPSFNSRSSSKIASYDMKFRHRHQLPTEPLSLLIRKINDTHFVAKVDTDSSVGSGSTSTGSDNSGAVFYVVAVVFIWGFSIILLIASYIRKSRMDNNISLYLKEIQTVQRRTRKEKILRFISLLQSHGNNSASGGNVTPKLASGSSGRRASSQSCNVSYAYCRSRSPSPTIGLAAAAGASGSLQLLSTSHRQQTKKKPTEVLRGHLQPPAPPMTPKLMNSETATANSELAAATGAKVERHNYGCFLPEICIESDVDLTGAESSISDVDEIAQQINTSPEQEDIYLPDTTFSVNKSDRNRNVTDM